MTTYLQTAVVVDGASHLVTACAWCCTRPQLVALNRAYPAHVSHAICPICEAKLLAQLEARS